MDKMDVDTKDNRKKWLENSIKAVINSRLSNDKKLAQIMRFIESYEITKEE